MKFYKLYILFRYDIPFFLRNIFLFRKLLWKYRTYDYYSVFLSMNIILVNLHKELKKSPEIEISKIKKLKKIERSIEILNNILEDRYMEISESIHGKFVFNFDEKLISKEQRIINEKVLEAKKELQKEEWDELFLILKGKEMKDSDIDFDEWFDGSDIRGWWR